MYKKILITSFIFFILIFNLFLVGAVTVVEQAPPTPEKQGFFASYFGFLKSPLFWGIMFILFILTLVFIGVFLLIRWLVKYIKSRNDIYTKMVTERISLAKIHQRYNSKHWWKVEKNTPIRIVKIINGKPEIGDPIGYHRGDYTTHEGNIVIALNLKGKKKFFFYPETELLIIPNREHVKLIQKKEQSGDKFVDILLNLPKPSDIIQFNKNEILLYVESLSKTGLFLIPVLKSSTGKIVDLSLPTYATLKEVVIADYLFEQSNEFVALSKKATDMNPTIRGIQKVSDPNQQVDITSGQQ